MRRRARDIVSVSDLPYAVSCCLAAARMVNLVCSIVCTCVLVYISPFTLGPICALYTVHWLTSFWALHHIHPASLPFFGWDEPAFLVRRVSTRNRRWSWWRLLVFRKAVRLHNVTTRWINTCSIQMGMNTGLDTSDLRVGFLTVCMMSECVRIRIDWFSLPLAICFSMYTLYI